jgi:hypothetical protein
MFENMICSVKFDKADIQHEHNKFKYAITRSACNILQIVRTISDHQIWSFFPQIAEFDWDMEAIRIIDLSFFFGYLVTQAPGGILAGKYKATM